MWRGYMPPEHSADDRLLVEPVIMDHLVVAAAHGDVAQAERDDGRCLPRSRQRRRNHLALPEADVVIVERYDQRKAAEHAAHPVLVDAIQPRQVDDGGVETR